MKPNQRVCTRTTPNKLPPWMGKQSSKPLSRLHLHHILQHEATAPAPAEGSPNTEHWSDHEVPLLLYQVTMLCNVPGIQFCSCEVDEVFSDGRITQLQHQDHCNLTTAATYQRMTTSIQLNLRRSGTTTRPQGWHSECILTAWIQVGTHFWACMWLNIYIAGLGTVTSAREPGDRELQKSSA